MIEIKAGIYYLGFFFLHVKPTAQKPGREFDVMGAIYKEDKPDSCFRLRYRFRYYHGGDDPWDGKDEKNWQAFVMPAGTTDEKAREEVTTTFETMRTAALQFGAEVDPFQWVEVKGNHERATFKLAMQPWSHIKLGNDAKDNMQERD